MNLLLADQPYKARRSSLFVPPSIVRREMLLIVSAPIGPSASG